MRKLPLTAGVFLSVLLAMPVAALDKDPNTGLKMAEGWQTVRDNCTACHSAGLVTQNSGSRNHWLGLIRWMQETQNLWQFDPGTEKVILDYLSSQYGPKDDARRGPLPRALMPENPYKSNVKGS